MDSLPTCTHSFTHSVFTDATGSVDRPWTRGLWLRSCEEYVSSWPRSEGTSTPFPASCRITCAPVPEQAGVGEEAIYSQSLIFAASLSLRGWDLGVPGSQEFPEP